VTGKAVRRFRLRSRARSRRSHIVVRDLEAFLPPEQAQEAFDMLDQDGDGQLTLAEVCAAITAIFGERRDLAVRAVAGAQRRPERPAAAARADPWCMADLS